jgi:hypothetical protein
MIDRISQELRAFIFYHAALVSDHQLRSLLDQSQRNLYGLYLARGHQHMDIWLATLCM